MILKSKAPYAKGGLRNESETKTLKNLNRGLVATSL